MVGDIDVILIECNGQFLGFGEDPTLFFFGRRVGDGVKEEEVERKEHLPCITGRYFQGFL